jgi:hypothetical protein
MVMDLKGFEKGYQITIQTYNQTLLNARAKLLH